MSKTTIQLRELVANNINIFDFPYTFYDNSRKAEFEAHFIKHFYMREIGSQPVGLFLMYLEDTFNLKLPYYNELFKTSIIEYEKLNNVKMTESYTRDIENGFEGTGTTTIDGNGEDNAENKYLDTPHGSIDIIDDGYMANGSKNKNTNTSHSQGSNTNNSTGSTSETFTKTTEGNNGKLNTELLKEHIKLQQILKNIEKMFFDECNELFLLVYPY